jgi:integrase
MTGKARANGEGSIYPHRNGFAAYVWVTTPAGKRTRKYVYGPDRETCHGKWIALQREAQRRPVVTSSPTVGDFLGDWMRDVIEPNRAPLTAATYESLVRLYLVPGLGTKRLDRLSVREVQTWLNGLRTACQCCAQGKDARRPESRRRCCAIGKCCRQVPSARTIRDLRTVLRSALSTAQQDELVTKNAAALVKVPSGRARKPKAWTSDEARAFLESARAEGDPLYALYVVILVLGLRKGEALGLAWEDVDLDGGQVAIRWQVQRVRRELLRRETKTEASDAPLPLPALCVTALRLRADRQTADREKAGAAWQDTGLVFTGRLGMPVDPRTVNRVFTARCRKAGVRKITVHDARRTCGTLLADLDVHPRVAMEILRHADFAVTMEIYTQVSSKQTREALRRLGESLEEPAPSEDGDDPADPES